MPRAATDRTSPSWNAAVRPAHWSLLLVRALPTMRGKVVTRMNRVKASTGTTVSTQTETTARAHGLSIRASASRQRHGSRPRRVGPIRWKRSGTPVRSASTW